MIKLYMRLENFWFAKIPEKIRFLLVGGFNTAVSYLIFLSLYYLFHLTYGAAIVTQYLISINLSIFTMRYYVFRATGNILHEYIKAAHVYGLMIAVNFAWMLVFYNMLDMSASISQAAFIIVSTIGTYLLHKYFSFKK